MARLGNIIAICALVAGAAGLGAYSRRDSRVLASNLGQERENAFKGGGFRAAAAVTGSYERTQEANPEFGPASVEELVRSGELVIVGRILSNHGVLAPSGDVIRTHYQVQVIRTLKGGSLIEGRDQIVVSVLGGRANVGNGTWGQLNIRYSEMPLNGQHYVLFLNRLPDDARNRADALDTYAADFWPARGFAGLVGLGSDGNTLRPADRRSRGNRPLKGLLQEPSKFIDEVTRIAKRDFGSSRAGR